MKNVGVLVMYLVHHAQHVWEVEDVGVHDAEVVVRVFMLMHNSLFLFVLMTDFDSHCARQALCLLRLSLCGAEHTGRTLRDGHGGIDAFGRVRFVLLTKVASRGVATLRWGEQARSARY